MDDLGCAVANHEAIHDKYVRRKVLPGQCLDSGLCHLLQGFRVMEEGGILCLPRMRSMQAYNSEEDKPSEEEDIGLGNEEEEWKREREKRGTIGVRDQNDETLGLGRESEKTWDLWNQGKAAINLEPVGDAPWKPTLQQEQGPETQVEESKTPNEAQDEDKNAKEKDRDDLMDAKDNDNVKETKSEDENVKATKLDDAEVKV
jgi:hypothetical protein